MDRLDRLIKTLREFKGPTICHEWPYPLLMESSVDEADIAHNSSSETSAPPSLSILNGGGASIENIKT